MKNYSNDRDKKQAELESLNYFLDAYQSVTGNIIEFLNISERPDFICCWENNGKVGVELAKVRRGHPNDILWDRLIEKQDYMSIENALVMIQVVATTKDKKRNEPTWQLPNETILLIELTDIPLARIQGLISSEIVPDLYSTGFKEIWLVDYTGLEAFDNVELFCVKPSEWGGYYSRGVRKPYG